ncbi:MAG: HD domain-containing protein [Anaerovoracaceae bacterium]|jgi:uncharacterized protein
MEILNRNGTPQHVVKHCNKVCEIAVKVGKALNKCGLNLNIQLIQASSLIHDVARTEDRHWDVGAKIAEDLGFYQEASIIKEHMTHSPILELNSLKEIDIVCLADRMVKEDEYVGLECRMQYVLDKFKGNPEAIEKIKAKLEDNRILLSLIEERIGTTIDDLVR